MRVAVVSNVSRAASDLAPDLMWQVFALAGTLFERTTAEGWEVSGVFDLACADLVKVNVDADVAPGVFATRVVAAISSNRYGEYRALIRAIASAQPQASAYVSELKVLLHRLLGKSHGQYDSPNSERDHVLQCALGELDSPSAT